MNPLRVLFILSLLPLLLAMPASADTRVRRNVEIEWEAVDGATGYEVQVTRKDDATKKPIRFKSKTPSWSATIKPGLYDMQIRSYDDRGVPGSWSPASELLVRLPSIIAISPKINEVVQAKDEKSSDVTLKWENVPGAAKYKVKVHTATGGWSEEKTVADENVTVSAPAGEFLNWDVVALTDKGELGENWSAPQSFEHRGPALEAPAIERPLTKYVKELKWSAPRYAQRYDYELKYFEPKSRKWQAVESKRGEIKTDLQMDISRPSGRYRFSVQAHGDRRNPSPFATLDFESVGGFRDLASLENAIVRDSISKPTNFYAIASYLITQMRYQGYDYDEGAAGAFTAIGGTGRLGAGYQEPQSRWGGFGIVDMSGFVIGGQNFTFSSGEVHITRKMEFGQGGLLQFASGAYMKQLPIIFGNETTGFKGVGKVQNIGPHVGVTYWTPLTARLGLQANARLYYALMGSTSDGDKIDSTMSYQYGLLGSYRLNVNWMGYAGYAFRKDETSYKATPGPDSFASEGQKNSIGIQGHYLNLILEVSF